MTDIVFTAPDFNTLHADAVRLGFIDADGDIIEYGAFPTGGGWFLNIAGSVEHGSGIWGRLRLNGDPDAFPSFDHTITQYVYSPAAGGWTADGTTLAPAWVGTVGLIA